MKKQPPMRYVDMAIYVDNHVHDKNADTDKIFEYLRILSEMLAVKRRFFSKPADYYKFSKYLASLVYVRMTDKRQWLPKDDPNYITPIKSCLNYIKQVLYVKKCAFIFDEFEQSVKVDYNDIYADSFKKHIQDTVNNASNNDFYNYEIELYFKTIDRLIYDMVYTGIYGNDIILCKKLYLSVVISLLRNFKLSNINKLKLIDFKAMGYDSFDNIYISNWLAENKQNIILKNNYDDILSNILIEENNSAAVVYDLDDEYLDYVAFLLQKIKIKIIKDIKEFSDEYNLPDDMIADILSADLTNMED